MTSLPDLRYETARDHLQQALAILPQEGAELIRLLVEEAARRCEAKAYDNVALLPLPHAEADRPDPSIPERDLD